MTEPSGRNASPSTSGSLLARNAYLNLIGQLAPILVAIFAIPLLIKVLGQERFGILALAWVVMGYFGLFDFGLGRATTKFVAEYYARNDTKAIPELIWSSLVVHVFLGLLGGAILALATPWLTQSALNVPSPLLLETQVCFYLLAVSVPMIVATAALRGVFEAIQRFDLVNLIKIPASILNYLGPLLVLYFVRTLVAVILFLVVSRAIVLLAHFFLCLRVVPALRGGFRFSIARIRPMVGFGGWLTIFSFVGPTIASMDRFLIGALVSLSAVALYTTPYEVVTKLMVFPASLLSVLFPAFSAMAVNRAGEIRELYLRACKYLLVMVAPIVGVLLALSYELLSVWVTPEFARYSAPVAQWLAVGVLIHGLAHVSFTVLQGIGRADAPAKLQLVELPFYALAVWALIGPLGITGVAMAWALRAAVDAVVLFVMTDRLLLSSDQATKEHFFWTSAVVICGFLLLFWGAGSLLAGAIVAKLIVVAILLGFFVLWEWIFFLQRVDRQSFLGGAKSFFKVLKSHRRK